LPARIEYVAETGSTNAELVARLAAGECLIEGHWLVADRQTAGRGRQGRTWLDAPGNFSGSTIVHLSPQDPPPATLSFVAALAVYESVVPRLPEPQRLQLKWPNDLLLDGAKFCGILLEREGASAVIGIGVNLAAAPALSTRAAQSLASYGPAPERNAFAEALATSFDVELARWRQYGTQPIFARWLAAAHPPGSPVRVQNDQGLPLLGTFEGLQDDGALRLRLVDGTCRVIHAGDVELGTP
jgi:BirA family biotin operon repressor/biotin-[acetyl-CoA-carboxylase] ligase